MAKKVRGEDNKKERNKYEYKRAGFKDTFTRIFSVITIIYGILLFTGMMEPPFLGAENLTLFLLALGIHGVVTNPYETGALRKLLCNLSGFTATIFLIYSFVSFLISLGLVKTDF